MVGSFSLFTAKKISWFLFLKLFYPEYVYNVAVRTAKPNVSAF